MILSDYIKVNNAKEYIIEIAKLGDKSEEKLFSKEDLLNQRYIDYPVIKIDNLCNGHVKITIDETQLKNYECVFKIKNINDKIQKEFKYTFIVDAFNKEEAELRGKCRAFKEYISEGQENQLIINATNRFISIGDIECVSIKEV